MQSLSFAGVVAVESPEQDAAQYDGCCASARRGSRAAAVIAMVSQRAVHSHSAAEVLRRPLAVACTIRNRLWRDGRERNVSEREGGEGEREKRKKRKRGREKCEREGGGEKREKRERERACASEWLMREMDGKGRGGEEERVLFALFVCGWGALEGG